MSILTSCTWIVKLLKNNIVSSVVSRRRLKSCLTNATAHHSTCLSNTPSIQISIKRVKQTLYTSQIFDKHVQFAIQFDRLEGNYCIGFSDFTRRSNDCSAVHTL